VADDFHVDHGHVFVAQDSLFLQVAEDERRSLSFADLDIFDRLRESLVRRSERAPEEVTAADCENEGEEEDGE